MVSIPTIASMTSPKHVLRREGRRLMALMQEARAESMNRKIRICILVDPEKNEVRAVEASVYHALRDGLYESIAHDSEAWALAMNNRFERVLVFSDDMILDGFPVDQIDAFPDTDDPFQVLDEDARESSTPTERPEGEFLALLFNHFGGSDGGGVSLCRDAWRLDIAADILTGRPGLVQRKPSDREVLCL
jgi:hypothetical protein